MWLGSRECPGWHDVLGCFWTYRIAKVRRPLLGSLILFGVPTLHVLPLHLRCSSTSPPQPFFPSSPCGSLQGIPGWLLTNAKGSLFLGSSGGEQHMGFAHRALAEQGRGPGALSGYNLGTINRGSQGSRFLFSFYPLQCLC